MQSDVLGFNCTFFTSLLLVAPRFPARPITASNNKPRVSFISILQRGILAHSSLVFHIFVTSGGTNYYFTAPAFAPTASRTASTTNSGSSF